MVEPAGVAQGKDGAVSRRFASLVEQALAGLQPRPVVSPEQYRAITCNRCGMCCEDNRLSEAPERVTARAADSRVDADLRRFLAGLVPAGPIPGGWRYRCRHFSRDSAGLGVCAIYAARPRVCSGFPYGRTAGWRECAWYVQVRDAHGNLVDQVSPANACPDPR